MVKVRGRRQGWGAIPVVVVVAVLAMMTGCPSNGAGNGGGGDGDPETFTVTLDRQGGSGGSTSVIATSGQPMPTATAPSKAGVVFEGYYAGLNGTGTQYYTAGMESARNWDLLSNTELIASWRYEIGAAGPAGGVVFYDKGEYTDGWRYLEAWTADEAGTYQWKTSDTYTLGTSTDLGSGHENTYTAMSGIEHPAAEVVRNATHGGYSDWFLPSKEELNEMYIQREAIGGFASAFYWSSSEHSEDFASIQYFVNGTQAGFSKLNGYRVRAARAF